jgi:hypothetical protein
MSLRVYYEVLNQRGTPALFTDTFANRPAFGFQGRLFISTNTGQIFEDTGTAWTLVADAGVGGGTLSSVCVNGNTTATGIVITAGGLTANQIIKSGGTAAQILAADGSVITAGTNITISGGTVSSNSTGMAIGGSITSATAGSVLFAGTSGVLQQDNANFFWDDTNNRLGIGTALPGSSLDIHGSGSMVQLNGTSTNNSYLLFQNAGTGKWRIGNLYNAGANTFEIHDILNGINRLTILNTGATTLNGSFTLTGALTGTTASLLNSSALTGLDVASDKVIFRANTGVSTPRQVEISMGGATSTFLDAKGFGANYITDFGIRTYNSIGTAFNVFYGTSAGNVIIGGTTDAGFRLDCVGTLRVTGNTTMNGNINISTGGGGTNTFNAGVNNFVTNANNFIGAINQTSASNAGSAINISTALGTVGQTSNIFNITSAANISSGTLPYNNIILNPTLNFTGTYSGIYRGLYYNPILTSITGVTHNAIETTTGNVLLNTTSGNTIIGTSIDNGQGKLQVSGNIYVTGIGAAGSTYSVSSTLSTAYYHVFTGAAGQTLTLPSPASNNVQYVIINNTANTVTVAAATSTNIVTTAGTSVASITLIANQRVFILANGGTNYFQIF